MTNSTRFSYLLTFFLALAFSANAQIAGDFRSKVSGNWSDFTTWQIYNGAAWNDAVAGEFPGGTSESNANNVYLEAGFTVTLTTEASCKDLHLNGTQDVVRINTNNNILNVWGKMRSYTGTAPGTTDGGATGSGIAGWVSTGATGSIRFRGTVDRVIVQAGELTANSRIAGWNMEFAFNSGVTGTVNKTIRCGHLIVSSGILFTGIEEIRPAGDDYTAQPGNGVSGGTCIVKSGAVFKTASIHKNNVTNAGNSLASFTLESGATLIPNFSLVKISALSYQLNGTVQYQNGSEGFLLKGSPTDAVNITNYTNVILTGSGIKSLQSNTTISGKLTRAGTASLSLNTFALTYGSSAALEYNGSTAQTTMDAELPSLGGPANLIINNLNGVTLHASRTISGQLTLTSGLFYLGNNHLTLGENSPTIAGTPSASNMIITSGTGELRKIFNVSGTFFFPIGDTTGTPEYSYGQIVVNSGAALNATTYVGVKVVDAMHAASGTASDKLSRYWAISTNISSINYDATFQYLASDVTGTETSIKSYLYSNETALASGSPVNLVNSVTKRIVMSGLTSTGYATGANHCSISNNSIVTPSVTEFCDPALISTFDGSAALVTSGSPSYQWQQSLNSGAYSNISLNGQSENYSEPSSLASGTYKYKRIVSDLGSCLAGEENTSNEITIVVSPSIASNTIGSNQAVVSGGNPNPLTGTATLTGGNGTYAYRWQSSSTQGGPYSDIASEISASYDPPAGMSSPTYFVRVVTSGGCSSTSNEILVDILTSAFSGKPQLHGLTLYPNPVSEMLTIDLRSVQYANSFKLLVQNSLGMVVYETTLDSGLQKLTIDLSPYSSGIYFATFTIDGEQQALYKIIKE